jgi:uncharacterized protein
MDIITLYWIVLALMGIGVIGSIIPGLPGSSIILVAIAIWSIATKFAGVGWSLILVFLVLILSAVIEYLAVYFGAKQVGASKWSQRGAIAGMVLGFFGFIPALPLGGPIFGVLFGAIIGAFVGEYIYRSGLESGERVKRAFQVSMGIVVSSIIGNVIEAFLAAIAVLIFIYTTWGGVFG